MTDRFDLDLVDFIERAIEGATDEPQFTTREHALMIAGELRRDWLDEHDRAVAAKALRDAQGLVKARLRHMQAYGADGQYQAALNDAWSLLNNRLREVESGEHDE